MGGFFGAKRARGAGAPGSPRGIARGGAAAGKKLAHDGFVRPGAVHRSNAGAGDRPRDAQQADPMCRARISIARAGGSLVQDAGPVNALHCARQWDARMQRGPDEPRPLPVVDIG